MDADSVGLRLPRRSPRSRRCDGGDIQPQSANGVGAPTARWPGYPCGMINFPLARNLKSVSWVFVLAVGCGPMPDSGMGESGVVVDGYEGRY